MSATASAYPIVCPEWSGRLGNHILQTYRAFWFATIHGIPFTNVMLRKVGPLHERPFFANVSQFFVSDRDLDKAVFNVTYQCHDNADQRRNLFDLSPSPGDGILIKGASFVYPELPWERSLFVRLFDNKAYRASVAARYRDLLIGNTVGYTVRRGDAVGWTIFKTLTDDEILSDWREIIGRYHGLVRIVVATDGVTYVDELVKKHGDVSPYVTVIRENEDNSFYLLSLCDSVVNNGQYECSSAWLNYDQSYYVSTFGQVAQILNRSYKYATAAYSEDVRELTRNWAYSRFPKFHRN